MLENFVKKEYSVFNALSLHHDKANIGGQFA